MNIYETFKQYHVLQSGHFQLASGRHSEHYLQVAQLFQHPSILQDMITAKLCDITALGKIDTVFSPAIGGIPVGQQLALALKSRAIFAERKAGENLKLRRGFSIQPNENLLLVEDVLTTGSTVSELLDIANQAAGNIRGVFAVVNRSGSENWRDLPLISIAKFDFPTFTANECPLCTSGIALTRPGTKVISATTKGSQNNDS